MSDYYFKPFKWLDLDTMEHSWFVALVAAYDDIHLLIDHLKELDDEINLSPRTNTGELSINPSLSRMWAWTQNVPFNEVKVIIVGSDPSNYGNGSGIAFHPLDNNNVCGSTKYIFSMIANHFNLRNWNRILIRRRNFSLRGWMDQGVVLVNAMTTKPVNPNIIDNQNRNASGEHGSWFPIMRRLFNHTLATKPNVVFMLAGAVARELMEVPVQTLDIDDAMRNLNLDHDPAAEAERDRLRRLVLVNHPRYQGRPNRYAFFPEGLNQINQLLQDNPIDFLRLDMWNEP